jgi:hypothetical protein
MSRDDNDRANSVKRIFFGLRRFSAAFFVLLVQKNKKKKAA